MSRKELLGLIFVVVIFVMASYFAKEYAGVLEPIVSEKGFTGMFAYILAIIIETVIAPLSSLPLIPVAVLVWGSFITFLLTVLGWLLGAIISFILARKYGRPLVSKFINLEKLEKLEKILPHENIFWSIVFLRVAIPVDLLSYALGLFTKVKLTSYSLATLIGIIPFAFVFSYAASLPIIYQVGAGVLAIVAIYLGYTSIKNKYVKNKPVSDLNKHENI